MLEEGLPVCKHLPLLSALCFSLIFFRNETDRLFKKLLKESCENSEGQKPVKKWNNSTSVTWDNIQTYMVKVST
jgi:hypothetical protein